MCKKIKESVWILLSESTFSVQDTIVNPKNSPHYFFHGTTFFTIFALLFKNPK